MNEIKIENIFAINDEELQQDLNNLHAVRIISIENTGEYRYKVIYEL